MKVQTNDFLLMNQLLNEARHNEPVMSLNEVENLISRSSGTAPQAVRTMPSRLGRNYLKMLIPVLSGVILLSILGVWAFRFDAKDSASKQPMPGGEKASHKEVLASVNPVVNPSDKTVATMNGNSVKRSVVNAVKRPLAKSNSNALEGMLDVQRNKSNAEVASPAISKVKVSESYSLESGRGGAMASSMNESDVSFTYLDKAIKMKLAGGDIASLSVDGKVILTEQLHEYDYLVSEGKKCLKNQNRDGDSESASLNLVQLFNNQLHADNIVAGNSPYSFELSSSQLLINKAAQDADAFKKYKTLYETKTGKTLTAGTVYSFERGKK